VVAASVQRPLGASFWMLSWNLSTAGGKGDRPKK
jgi:hypothetical protein